jgi:L,D-peptidoglycan transpeptidase YkuD (ErfK/YbiS/YcfS/YnhG family)
VQLGQLCFPCLLGKNGLRGLKREGDGVTPVGQFRLLALLERRDRAASNRTSLPKKPLKPSDGWCDAVGHRSYNRPVRLPFSANHEVLWRSDAAYDALVLLDYNFSQRRQARGSAIFFHLIRDGASHTEGCIAVAPKHMRMILRYCGAHTKIVIWPPGLHSPNVFRK